MNEPLNNIRSNSAIMNQIEVRIADYRQANADDASIFPAYPYYPSKPSDIPYDVALYQHLETAKIQTPMIPRDRVLVPSKLDRVPIVGRLWLIFRRQLHNIALFYTDRVLQHQVQINLNLVEAMGRLTAVTQQQQRQIKTLQQQLAQSQEADKA